ncbi:GNAT family N-acetyltransferase [Dysgonomonas capnocytophagoides]|uniref:GNAT family N-acetyltransferase n=1 Tax=Dysgonomonas capnocytophagoides TaxID=45254 RepID=UPI0030C872CE
MEDHAYSLVFCFTTIVKEQKKMPTQTINNLFYRLAENEDWEKVCKLPQNEEELFFMFPKADYPLSVEQLQTVVENRSDSTVILLDNKIVGFANFYEVKENNYCSIGNVIVSSNFRNKGIGKYLIETMESIALEKYNVREIHISCFNINTKGILLYSKLSYLPYEIEERLDKEKHKIALIKMKRSL